MELLIWGNHRLKLNSVLEAHGVPKAIAEALIPHHMPVSFQKGATVFAHGSPADLMCWVMSGLLKVYCPNPDGSRFMIQLAGPGDLVGYVNVMIGEEREVQAFGAEALSKCSVAFVTREQVTKSLEKLEAPILANVVKALNGEWCRLFADLTRFLGLSFQERLELVLANLGERLGAPEARGLVLISEFSHEELAEMIGSSRPMVSRLIANMIEEGVIVREGKRYIVVRGSRIDRVIAPRRDRTCAAASGERSNRRFAQVERN
jgi:CRP/FNR family cyclic AMP-dependent transcriptional regulator